MDNYFYRKYSLSYHKNKDVSKSIQSTTAIYDNIFKSFIYLFYFCNLLRSDNSLSDYDSFIYDYDFKIIIKNLKTQKRL